VTREGDARGQEEKKKNASSKAVHRREWPEETDGARTGVDMLSLCAHLRGEKSLEVGKGLEQT